ncbi:uncharacterized protein LOC144036736 isoform X4 [Vanacampus margaritifer]
MGLLMMLLPLVYTNGFEDCRHDRHQPLYGHSSDWPPQQWKRGTWSTWIQCPPPPKGEVLPEDLFAMGDPTRGMKPQTT